jgi:predicted KAP-like P-loop ATPase
MWQDNETSRDFLNFSGVADTVAEVIVQAKGRPVSIGVSGAWGTGKSSLIKLTRGSLEQRQEDNGHDFVFVEFNAWLYQGYDDARAALMEEIATTLESESTNREKGVEKVSELLGRVNWLRVAKLTTASAVALAMGLPPVGLIGQTIGAAQGVLGDNCEGKDIEQAQSATVEFAESAGNLINTKQDIPIENLETHLSISKRSKYQHLIPNLRDAVRTLSKNGHFQRIYNRYGAGDASDCGDNVGQRVK